MRRVEVGHTVAQIERKGPAVQRPQGDCNRTLCVRISCFALSLDIKLDMVVNFWSVR